MDSRLKNTIEKLKIEQALKQSELAVFFCPALNQKRFKKEIKNKGIWWKKSIPKEFVKLQTQIDDTWEGYKKRVVLPILSDLLYLENETKVKVVLDASKNDFVKTLKYQDTKLIFLVAHHIERNTIDAIEFADRVVPTSELTSDIKDSKTNRSIIFIVCNTNEFIKEIVIDSVDGSIGWASWQMPLHGGIRFISELVSNLDGNTKLSEAYDKTIRILINND